MMKKFMGGMGVNQGIISKPNTFFIVNQRRNAPMRRVDQDGIPIIDDCRKQAPRLLNTLLMSDRNKCSRYKVSSVVLRNSFGQ
jgi:hypothetical protein